MFAVVIIYGPEYTAPEHLERSVPEVPTLSAHWRYGNLPWGSKPSTDSLEREPLRRVHECVFGVLALESEPVDPRL